MIGEIFKKYILLNSLRIVSIMGGVCCQLLSKL